MRLYGFDAIVAKDAKVMILGSMPSVTSLAKQEYYGYKHNRFWKIMQAYFHTKLSTYEEKKQCILAHHLVLWDVIGSCEREGSLDAAIHHEQCNDIVALCRSNPSIELILCNGRKSFDLYERHFAKQLDMAHFALPSTSNANRTIKESDLFAQWFDKLSMVDLFA